MGDGRVFLSRGPLQVNSKKSVYFLFKDLLLLTKAQGDSYQLLHYIRMKDLQLQPKSKDVYTLRARDIVVDLRDDKKQTHPALQLIEAQVVAFQKQDSVFSLSIEEILERQEQHCEHFGVPVLVDYLVTHIRKYGLNTEGLLRQEGKLTRVEDLKRKFDKVQSSPTDVDLLSYQIH